MAHSLTLKQQGVWLQWSENTLPFDFSWKNLIWSSNYHIIKFVLNASINWVKTPSLLKLWGISNSGLCHLCSNDKCTLHHILSHCPVALRTKRYTWIHDSVLLHIQLALQSHLDSWNSTNKVSTPRICFVKAGAKIYNNFKKSSSTPTKSDLICKALLTGNCLLILTLIKQFFLLRFCRQINVLTLLFGP